MSLFRTLGALAVVPLAAGGCADREPPPEPTRRLHAVLPSTAIVGEPVDLLVAALGDVGTPDPEWAEGLEIASSDPGLRTGTFVRTDPGLFVMRDLAFETPGVHRITVTGRGGDVAIAGPVRVAGSVEEFRPRHGASALRVWWGDAHGHSDVGDGTYPPRQYFYYAREVAGLDFTCLSEHDYQQFLEVGFDRTPGSWEAVADEARAWRRPGFAVLLGWEWSSRFHGHRVVLFPSDEHRYVSFQETTSPAELADALRGTGAFSIIAHPAGSELTPVINWDTVQPGFDRAIEVYSGHGTMDAEEDFRPTSEPRPGMSALDAIRRGLHFALVAFSDTHLSTPGNPWPPPLRDAPYRGGLTAVLAPAATEADVFAALRDGHCYATSGERFLVELRVGDRIPGETLVTPAGAPIRLTACAAAPRGWKRLEILVGDRVAERIVEDGATVDFSREIGPIESDAAVWLSGESLGGERFWTTPVWVVVE